MRRFSCDPQRLYEFGGLYAAELDEQWSAKRLGTWMTDVFPGYSYERAPPRNVFSHNAGTPQALFEEYERYARRFSQGAPSQAYALENAVLLDRTIYTIVPPGELLCVYETDREIDRPWKRLAQADQQTLNDCLRPTRAGAEYVYFSSIGSENYAHWLVDDLPRLKAVADRFDPAKTVLLLDAYFPAIDDIRVQSIRALIGSSGEPEIAFIDKSRPYFFERLTYVSPASYTPVLKSPDAVRYVCERLAGVSKGGPKRIFVGRNALWRKLLNPVEVTEFFSARSFEVVTIDFGSMSFLDQVRTFSNAEIVVGVSGASMVNTMFAPPGARVVYLAGEGFTDPWYWDLAAVTGHEYSVCFGTPWKPEAPNFSSFAVDSAALGRLEKML